MKTHQAGSAGGTSQTASSSRAVSTPTSAKVIDDNLSEESAEARAENRVPNKEVVQTRVGDCLVWEVSLRKEIAADKFGFVQANGKLEFEARLANSGQRPGPQPAVAQPIKPPEMSPLPGPEVLIVRRIHENELLDRWNKRHPHIAVHPSDRIISVNGDSTLEGMQREIRSSKIVVKFLRYPEQFTVKLKKDGRRLGFRFERPPPGAVCEDVRMTEVLLEGALPDYNKEQVKAGKWHLVVLPDMRIMAANSVSGDGAEIAEELKLCEEVTLIIQRAEHRVDPATGYRADSPPGQARAQKGTHRNPFQQGDRGRPWGGHTSSSSSDGYSSSQTPTHTSMTGSSSAQHTARSPR